MLAYKGARIPTVEELDAELARRHFLDYARFVNPSYQTPAHIQRLAEHLEAVERGEITRLMVSMPPQHGKSTTVSQAFPSWYLGRHQDRRVVNAGYALDIALKHSKAARDIFFGERHQIVFPGSANKDEQSAQEWGTTRGGSYRAVGVGGGLTGFGADLEIVDDPVKNREEAESLTISNAVWDWYRSTLYTRLSPIGAIIVCMTRWGVNDLAGHLIAEAEASGDKWVTLVLPAIDEGGKALWPERYPIEELEKKRLVIGAYEWSALYMQQPTKRGGNMLRADKIVIHDNPADFPDTRYVRFWDLASTKKERAKDDPDYTVGALVGRTEKDGVPSVWVKHCEIAQAEAPERNEKIVATARRDGAGVRQLIESVAGYKDAETTLKKILYGVSTVQGVSDLSGDKVVRAGPLEPIIDAANLHIMRGEWNRIFLDHFTWFPNGTHDDCVDAVSGAYNELMKPTPRVLNRRDLGM